jgi:hypothetical protein
MRTKVIFVLIFAVIAAVGTANADAAIRAGFSTSALGANDDGSTGFTSFGFTGPVDFFGTIATGSFLNNNGNMTFAAPSGAFTPSSLTGPTLNPIIAAFFADVDTRGSGSDLMRYGTGTVGGRDAFGVTWDGVGVGYYFAHTDRLNQFQMVLVERFDTGIGNFDIEFNYDQIQWETGDASGGSGGLGGVSAYVGYSGGSGVPGTFAELSGSGVNGAFLDGGPPATELISNSLGASIDRGTLDGQYVFQVREGIVINQNVPEPATFTMFGLGALGFGLASFRRRFKKA